jgi:hypothetical protein
MLGWPVDHHCARRPCLEAGVPSAPQAVLHITQQPPTVLPARHGASSSSRMALETMRHMYCASSNDVWRRKLYLTSLCTTTTINTPAASTPLVIPHKLQLTYIILLTRRRADSPLQHHRCPHQYSSLSRMCRPPSIRSARPGQASEDHHQSISGNDDVLNRGLALLWSRLLHTSVSTGKSFCCACTNGL